MQMLGVTLAFYIHLKGLILQTTYSDQKVSVCQTCLMYVDAISAFQGEIKMFGVSLPGCTTAPSGGRLVCTNFISKEQTVPKKSKPKVPHALPKYVNC